jgi:hypothetical protein
MLICRGEEVLGKDSYAGQAAHQFCFCDQVSSQKQGRLRHVEGFISALLAMEGYKPVKINALLESESNRESEDLKRSIADLVVQEEKGNKYIVEIGQSFTPSFMQKACFNTSRLVINSISGNQNYITIRKVFTSACCISPPRR